MEMKKEKTIQIQEDYLEQISDDMIVQMELSPQFAGELSDGYWANMKLNYLLDISYPERCQRAIQMYQEGTLLDYLLKIETMAKNFRMTVEPKLMKSFGLTEEMKIQNQEKYNQLMNNLYSTLMEMTVQTVITEN
ncbi:MAG: TnpV protein [Fusobacterium periodonticum]|nr:TnpV protein [Fusobacterium periodonticum]